MSGIRDLMGLVFWFDNDKRLSLETSLQNDRPVSKERSAILKDLGWETSNSFQRQAAKLGKNDINR